MTSPARSRLAPDLIDRRAALGIAGGLAVAVTAAVGTRHEVVVDWATGALWRSTCAVGVLILLGSSHFLLSAWGLRAASGRPLPMRATALVQLAAAATNRVVPNGVGGTAVNLRYLLRCGVPAGAAMSALATLALVAGVTDVAFAGAVTAVGPAVGLAGAGRELSALAASGVAAGRQQSWLIAVVVVPVAVAVLVRARRAGLERLLAGMSDAVTHLRDLACQPRRVVAAALASTMTSAVLGAAFVLAVHMWGGPSAVLPSGALVAVYLVGSAAGGTAPVPAFFLLTEVALVGGLVLGGYAWGPAVLAVCVFRVVTYWLPLPVGLWAGSRLRAARLL